MWSTRSRHTGAVMYVSCVWMRGGYKFPIGWGVTCNSALPSNPSPTHHFRIPWWLHVAFWPFYRSLWTSNSGLTWSSVLHRWRWFSLTYIYIYIVNSRYFNRSVFKINEAEEWKTTISYGFECPDVPDKFTLNHLTHTPSDNPPYRLFSFHFVGICYANDVLRKQ